MGVFGAEGGDMGEGVRIAGIVGVDEDVAGVELGFVFEDGGLELAEFFEDEVALLATRQLDAVDGRAGFYGRVIGA